MGLTISGIAINIKHDFFKNSFFLSTLQKWNKRDLKIRNSAGLTFLKRIVSKRYTKLRK